MKKYKPLTNFLLGSLFIFGMTACLKDDAHYIDFTNLSVIADIPTSANFGIEDRQSFALSKLPTPYAFDVKVESKSPTTANTNITVGVDAAFLTKYNANNGTNYAILPDSTYAIGNPTVTVPAGKTLGTINMSFSTSKINAAKANDPATGYALPISIKSATNGVIPSTSFGSKLIIVSIK